MGSTNATRTASRSVISRYRPAIWLAVSVLLGASSLAVSSTPAQAAPCPSVDVGYTIKTQNVYIKGSGSTPCGGATITLQRYQWPAWRDLTSVTTSGAPRTVSYYCYGTGTQTYRTLVWYWSNGGAYISKASNQLQANC